MEGTADFASSSFFVKDGCDLEEIWVELQYGTSIFGLDCVCGNLENETEADLFNSLLQVLPRRRKRAEDLQKTVHPLFGYFSWNGEKRNENYQN